VHLDSDDYMHQNLIQFEHEFLALNLDWGAVECDYVLVDDHEKQLSRMTAKEHPIACGIMFRKDCLIAIGLYNEAMLLCEDQELRERFEQRYTVGYMPLPYYRYTRHMGNITNNHSLVEHYKQRLTSGV
jgi:hypothetical protein